MREAVLVSSNLSETKKLLYFRELISVSWETLSLATAFGAGRASLLRQHGTGAQLALREPRRFDYIKPFEKSLGPRIQAGRLELKNERSP